MTSSIVRKLLITIFDYLFLSEIKGVSSFLEI